MPLYAIEELDDAFRVTRSFLTPVDLRTWLKLAVVIFFIGATTGGGGSGAQFNVPADETPIPGEPLPGDLPLPDFGVEFWLLVAGLAVLALVVGLAFLFVGSVMEFVLVESLRNEEVTIRRYWDRRWRQGLRLFGFRLVVGLVILAGVAALLAPLILGMANGDVTGGAVGFFLLLVPVFILLSLVVALVNSFTTMFVVPIMVLEDTKVLEGWRRLWPTIRPNWQQYLAYVVAQVILSLVAGLLVGLVAGGVGLFLLIPFGLLGLVGLGLLTVSTIAGAVVIGLLAVVYVLALIAIVAVAQVPVQSYLRYYAMLVLGDVDTTLDVVPTQRAAARESDVAAGA